MEHLHKIVILLLMASVCMAQKNADSKYIGKKKIKEINASIRLMENSYENENYFTDSVFIALRYDQKGRLLERKDSLKRFVKDSFLLNKIETYRFDSIGNQYFTVVTHSNSQKSHTTDTSLVFLSNNKLNAGYVYSFHSSDQGRKRYDIDFYAHSKNQKENIAFPAFYHSPLSGLVNGAEYVKYNVYAYKYGQEEAEILRNDMLYVVGNNYGRPGIHSIYHIEKTDSGFITRRFNYINNALVYDNTISYTTKPKVIGRLWIYKFVPDVKLKNHKGEETSTAAIIDDRGMKGHFAAADGPYEAISGYVNGYLECIKYNDNVGKNEKNTPNIRQEPEYTLKYYSDNKYTIQIKYYNQ